jgi:hypothetical protein
MKTINIKYEVLVIRSLQYYYKGQLDSIRVVHNAILFSVHRFPPRRYDVTGKSQMQGGKTGFCRQRKMQTGSSDTLIGWKSGPLWDVMERAWLWAQVSSHHINLFV